MQTKIFSGLSVALFTSFAFGVSLPTPALAEDARAEDAPKVQIAILLDTSNSMDGLINQCREQLWKIVNEFGTAKLAGKKPHLEVALYEYGNDGLPAKNGHVRQVLPFADDLDKISEELFALKTNGGEEYCGTVIQTATKELKWSDVGRDVKMIFIAGNEPFTQGSVKADEACKAAAKESITVSTVFCGNSQEGIQTGWRDGAMLADGSFMTINPDAVAADIATPFDKKLAEANSKLNGTYVFYGDAQRRKEAVDRQVAQDENAVNLSQAAAASRVATKGSSFYRNAHVDLVDALKEKKVELKDLTKEQLPEELKDLSAEEREKFIAAKADERATIQAEIKQLSEDREKFLAEARAKAGEEDAKTLDNAVINAVREQGAKKNLTFEK